MDSHRVAKLVLCICVLYTVCPLSMGKSYEEDLTITLEQKAQLDKFKALVESRLPHKWMKEEVYLLRWLRARNWDLRRAEEFLMDNIKWRAREGIDGILTEDWSDFDKDIQYWLEGRDREGKPIAYLSIQRYDLRKVIVTGAAERFNRFLEKAFEESCALVRELGEKYHNVSQGILLVNLDGFNLVQHGCLRCVPLVLRIPLTYENHHPGCADKIILINTPSIFEPLLNSIRTLLSHDTNQALEIYGTNKKIWREVVERYFDWDQLPPELGGTKLYKGMEEY